MLALTGSVAVREGIRQERRQPCSRNDRRNQVRTRRDGRRRFRARSGRAQVGGARGPRQRAALPGRSGGVVHANCVATIWQLTATIAHDLRQLVASTITKAQVLARMTNISGIELMEARAGYPRSPRAHFARTSMVLFTMCRVGGCRTRAGASGPSADTHHSPARAYTSSRNDLSSICYG